MILYSECRDETLMCADPVLGHNSAKSLLQPPKIVSAFKAYIQPMQEGDWSKESAVNHMM